MPFDDDEETPLPCLFDEANEDSRARAWRDREMQYVQEIASLKAQLAEAHVKTATAILERAQLALELNNVRRRLSSPVGKKEVKS